ncbi:MAG TPA: cytochrome ubiquinol oxidase subunit I [Candidatus Baltobacterales bacterium]|nr:cytochrome ubiquinol oxidase subunit I [Candidatus Baltobacterales bacterium]
MNNLTLARATMGTSLGFHIVFAVLGVGMPALMMVAEAIWLRTGDRVWLGLARRWAKAFGILFAVGAVSGTVLSFELGLLWPRFMAFSGSMIGLPFSAEAFAFFTEAIFLGLYLYGWDRLSPLQHWLTSIPIALSGAASSLFVVMANSWMNSPTGFTLGPQGQLLSVNPLAAAFNPSTWTEDPHMLVSAYVATGFVVAAVYAAGILRGRNDAHHRRALLAGLAMATLAIALAGVTGDSSARFIYAQQPAKFAAMEGLYHTERGAPIHLGGIPLNSQQRVVFAIEIPRALSLLAAFNPNAKVLGLDAFPAQNRPNPILVHFSFDTMVGLGGLLGLLALAFWLVYWRRRVLPRRLLPLLVIAGPASVLTMEAGWCVTEFGRQPWIVYGILRTSQAVTSAPGLGLTFAVFLAIYSGLAFTTARLLLRLAARERAAQSASAAAPTAAAGPPL